MHKQRAIAGSGRVMLGLLAACAVRLTLAQTTGSRQPEVLTPPPKIEFAPWRQSRIGEDTLEFETSFPSAFVTAFPENNTVRLRAFLPSNSPGPAPSVLILHYWGATDLRLESALAADLNRRGIAAVVLTLPYHMQRTPKGYRSGELAIQPNPDALIENMVQSVWDVRRAVDWIQSRPEFKADAIGIAGTSLGAIVAAMCYAVEPRFSRAAFLLGGIDLAHMLWYSSRTLEQREAMRRAGLNETRLREAVKEIEPLNYLKTRGEGRELVVSARFDTVVPPVDTAKLISALGRPNTMVLQTGHFGGVLIERSLIRSVGTFFASTFAGREYRVPTRLFSPTVRLGFEANPLTGAQVALGIDVWKANRQGDAFLSLLATPRGPAGYLGLKLTQNVSVGAILVRRGGASVAAFWSLVL